MNNIKWNFSDESVLIVGGSRGIGKTLAEIFKLSGANVAIISKDNCDISKKKEIDKYFLSFNKDIDILVNVAAINYTKKINDISYEEWEEVISTNLTSYYYIIKKTIDKMKDGGKIVNVSSIAGRNRSIVSGAHYTSSKAAIIGLTRQLAFEFGERNINVNVVCPSQTLTDMLKDSMTDEQLKELAQNIPLKRIANVNEQVYPIMFLCSEEASYITGAVIDVNGGQL
jgi:3-oxoacyl-[acyl-carrier protein] reductase